MGRNKAAKATIMALRETGEPAKNRRPVYAVPRGSGPALRQPTFDWKVQDK